MFYSERKTIFLIIPWSIALSLGLIAAFWLDLLEAWSYRVIFPAQATLLDSRLLSGKQEAQSATCLTESNLHFSVWSWQRSQNARLTVLKLEWWTLSVKTQFQEDWNVMNIPVRKRIICKQWRLEGLGASSIVLPCFSTRYGALRRDNFRCLSCNYLRLGGGIWERFLLLISLLLH